MAQRKVTTDWASKPLGGGNAAQVPEYLLHLQSKKKSQRVAAAKWLTDALLEEGAYPAIGPDVVAALIETLQSKVPDPAVVVSLLVDLSVFNHAEHAVLGVNNAMFRGPLKKAYQTFCGARATFENLLLANEAKTRAAGAFALAFIGDGAAEISKLLNAHLGQEREPTAVASYLLALALSTRHGGAPLKVNSFLQSEEPIIHAAAAIALGIAEKKPKPTTTRGLVDALTLPDTELLWFDGRLSFYALQVLVSNPKSHASVAVPALQALVVHSGKDLDEYGQLMVADATVGLGFSEFANRANDPVTKDELSAEQIDLLRSLQTFGVRSATFEEYGLPREPEAFRLLSGSSEGPLDKVLDVSVGRKKQQHPVWKCLHLCLDGELAEAELAKALIKQVPKAELFEVLQDASTFKDEVPVIPASVVLACLDWLGKDALEPAKKLCDSLAKSPEQDPPLAFLGLNALLQNGVKSFPDSYGAVAALLSQDAEPIGLEKVVAGLSAAARKKYGL